MGNEVIDIRNVLEDLSRETRDKCDISILEDFVFIDYLHKKIGIDVEIRSNVHYKGYFYLKEDSITINNIKESIEKYNFLLLKYDEYRKIREKRVIKKIDSMIEEF